MSEQTVKSQHAADVTPIQPPARTTRCRRQSADQFPNVYDWLIPLILIFLALVLASIIIASLAAMVGWWPG